LLAEKIFSGVMEVTPSYYCFAVDQKHDEGEHMMKLSRTAHSAVIATLLLTGCAETNSIYRTTRISGNAPTAIAVDAKQRLIISQIRSYATTNSGQLAIRAYCAEPSPDAFSVLAQSASGGASLGLDRDAKTLNAAIQGAFSNAETGTTIPRTQTINMLREMMFRTCERYLSGAISDVELPIVAIRDQRVMVSILAIEQLTGTVTPKPVIISMAGEASAGFDATKSMEILAKAQDGLKAANSALDTAKTAREKADKDAGSGGCTQLEKAEKPDTDKLKACTESKAALSKAEDAQKVAKTFYDNQIALANKGQGVSSASVSPGAATDVGKWSDAQKEAVKEVAGTVDKIVEATFNQDETQFFCFKQIGDPEGVAKSREALKAFGDDKHVNGILASVQAQCLDYLMSKVNAEAAENLGMSIQQYRQYQESGIAAAYRDQSEADKIATCVGNAENTNKIVAEMKKSDLLKDLVTPFQNALGKGQIVLARFIMRLEKAKKPDFDAVVKQICD
jgi:hypothetical protein